MKPLCGILVALCCWQAAAQESADPVAVTTAHPRLLLPPRRLRLLRRERERNSMRWEQFAALVAGHAALPEPGFALALYYRIADDDDAGRRAVAFALGPQADLRQQALVYDWCQPILSDADRRALAARLEKAISAPPSDSSVSTARSRALAAIALFDDVPGAPARELDRLVHRWWEGEVVPAVEHGRPVIARDDAYALFELLHTVRDSTVLDLRERLPLYFRDLPTEHLISNYPAPYDAAGALYILGAEHSPGEPDLRRAALSRAAELAMVAFDVNSQPSQLLQGWLMQDRFLLRSPFGTPYEFLWADPYLPGLSYDRAPLVFHDSIVGTLFIRSGWEDSASWFGWFDGRAQCYQDGLRSPGAAPLRIGPAAVCFAASADACSVQSGSGGTVFLVGLTPRSTYAIAMGKEKKWTDKQSDPGGILELELPANKPAAIRWKVK